MGVKRPGRGQEQATRREEVESVDGTPEPSSGAWASGSGSTIEEPDPEQHVGGAIERQRKESPEKANLSTGALEVHRDPAQLGKDLVGAYRPSVRWRSNTEENLLGSSEVLRGHDGGVSSHLLAEEEGGLQALAPQST